MDPFVNLHNCALDDEPLAIAELMAFRHAGGRTVVDPTCRGIGRNPEALVRISEATGLNIVMGAGYYLESSHPPEVATSPPTPSPTRSWPRRWTGWTARACASA